MTLRPSYFKLSYLAISLALSGHALSQTLPTPPVHAQPAPSSSLGTRTDLRTSTAAVQRVDHLPAARVQATLADYDRWLDRLTQRNAVAGLATAVVVDDRVVFERTLGYADVSARRPVTPDTVFRLASLSKAFATAITAILVHEGKLGWDTHLASVLPYFKLKDTVATSQATVGDILGQRTGLPHNTYDNLIEEDVPYSTVINQLSDVDLTCAMGQCYSYQNVAFSLIGDVIYSKTGQFFYQLVYRRLFGPLGMRDASYGREALESSASWARPHRASGKGWIPFEPKDTYYHVAPAAGVNASVRDMEAWLIAQMGGHPDVLDADELAMLHQPAVPTPAEARSTPWRRARVSDAHYALGWRVFTYGDQTLVFHAGAVEGYRTMIGFFPKYHAGVVTLWNSASPTPSGLMPMLFDDLLGLPHVDWADIESDAPAAAPRTKLAPAHGVSGQGRRRQHAPAAPSQNHKPRGTSPAGKPKPSSKGHRAPKHTPGRTPKKSVAD